MAYQSVNPYDGKILKTFEELSDKQLETALETAATCFETLAAYDFRRASGRGRESGRDYARAHRRVRSPGDARDG